MLCGARAALTTSTRTATISPTPGASSMMRARFATLSAFLAGRFFFLSFSISIYRAADRTIALVYSVAALTFFVWERRS